jgi:acetyltransferase-like isoleucine patch superfamily enzyme
MLPSHFVIGDSSTVEIESTSENFMGKIFITCGKNSTIKIKGIKVLNSILRIYCGDDADILIGSNQLMNGSINISAHEKSKITIGENCLWANTMIWSSDMHKIIDLESNERINHAQDITVGNHVWFGEGALILKGSLIHDNCIIGAHSVITKSTFCNPNSIIAGNPARIVKTNVSWQL